MEKEFKIEKLISPDETILLKTTPIKSPLVVAFLKPNIPTIIVGLVMMGGFITPLIITSINLKGDLSLFPMYIFFSIFILALLFIVLTPIIHLIKCKIKIKNAIYVVTDKQIIINNPFISNKVVSINFNSIDFITISQTKSEKIHNAGSVVISANQNIQAPNKHGMYLSRIKVGLISIENHVSAFKIVDKVLRDYKTAARSVVDNENTIEQPTSTIVAPKMKQETADFLAIKKQAAENQKSKSKSKRK